jgi:hypothetical protein
MMSRKDAGKSLLLVDFTDDVRIPKGLITDGATEFTRWQHTEFVKEA